MPIAKLHCPSCKAPAVVASERIVGTKRVYMYECGHADEVEQLQPSSFDSYVSLDGKRPMQFQIEGALFAIEEANGRCLIADEQGLGKTIQAGMILWAHRREFCRTLILCKSKLRIQMEKELIRWNGEDFLSQLVSDENECIVPGIKAVIISFDTFWRFKDIPAFMAKGKFKSVIMDEVQHFKNSNAKRTNGVRQACQCVKYVIALSGTPIANHAAEFFPILNMLHPERYPFNKREFYLQSLVSTWWSGRTMKYGGISNLERFKSLTRDFIIRRTRAEVMPQLPPVMRDFRFTDLGVKVNEAYQTVLNEFVDYYDNNTDRADVRASNVLAYLSRMRHLTGIAKIEPCVSFVEDFIHDTDRKIVIFTHHLDVAKKLKELLEECAKEDPELWGEILSIPKDPNLVWSCIEQFKSGKSRILLASILGDAEGLNLQFCSDMICLEQEWTPNKEEQAEGRFPRHGQLADSITATYLIAVGTVDEKLVKLKERKRQFIAQAVDGVDIKWDESDVIQELAEVLAQSGRKQWSN